MAILHVGSTQQVRTGSTSSKEEDYENDAATIVQKCVSGEAGCLGESLFVCVQKGRYGAEFATQRVGFFVCMHV